MGKFFCLCASVLMAGGMSVPAMAGGPEAGFGGQYRINSYTLRDKDGSGDLAAARVRIRQNVDLKFSEQFNTHLQLNIGHITEGIGNHTSNTTGSDNLGNAANTGVTVGLRHAVMSYKFSDAAVLKAGLVPMSDRFGDTLFSGDWDFNPLTYSVVGMSSGIDYRLAWFKGGENGEVDKTTAATTKNDMTGYLLDVGGNAGIAKVGGMLLAVQTPKGGIGVNSSGYDLNTWIGIRADGSTGNDKCNWHVSTVNASVDKSAFGTADDAQGIQLLVKADGKAGTIRWGALALYSTGDKGGEGFISPQTLYGGQGYWGNTGILNIQGPTDTGMDQNMLRTDNGGLGLTTIQASVSSPLMMNLDGYAGAGWYRANEENAGGDDDIGTDLYAQVKYRFPNSPLALDAGLDIASLGKAAPNSGGDSRTATAVFSRLQAEF